jgi:hypothetical protein
MPTDFPPKSRSARTGSNLPAATVLEDAYRGETSSKVLNKEQAAFKRDREQFLMKDALSRAAPIFQEFRTRFDRSVLDSEGNVGEIRRIKWRMQTALKGILSETIPHYRRYRSTEKSHIRRTYSSLRDQFRGAIATGVDARLGEHVTVDQKTFNIFFQNTIYSMLRHTMLGIQWCMITRLLILS